MKLRYMDIEDGVLGTSNAVGDLVKFSELLEGIGDYEDVEGAGGVINALIVGIEEALSELKFEVKRTVDINAEDDENEANTFDEYAEDNIPF